MKENKEKFEYKYSAPTMEERKEIILKVKKAVKNFYKNYRINLRYLDYPYN